MKKLFISLCAPLLLAVTMQTTFATGVIAGATFPQQIVDLVQQYLIKYDTTITAASEYYQKYKIEILDPLANAMIAAAQQKVANDLISWANGGFRGTPSFINNPGKFIKNQGLSAVKNATISIKLTDPYANSILNGVIKSFRSNESTEQQLANLAVSQVPVLLQDNVCKDATLTKLATDQVRNRDGTTNYSAMITQKTFLYQKLCNGNPLRDAMLARNLNAVAQANPALSGLDGILVISSGDNQYARQTRGVIIAQEAAAKADAEAKARMLQGGGMIGQRVCKISAKNPETGEDYCKEWEDTTPAGLVQLNTAKAQTTGLGRLENIQGKGALSNFLTGFATIVIANALKSAITSSSEPDVVLRNQTAIATSSQYGNTNDSQTVVVAQPRASTTYRQDLVNEEKNRTSLLQPLNKTFNTYKNILDTLDALDAVYLAEFTTYQTEVNTTYNLCMVLASSSPGIELDPAFVEASTTVHDRKLRVTKKSDEIHKEQANIQLAYAHINKYRTQINESYSSEQISDLFDEYTNLLEEKEYPIFEAFAERKGDYEKTKEDAKSDLNGGTSPPGGLASAKYACRPRITFGRPQG